MKQKHNFISSLSITQYITLLIGFLFSIFIQIAFVNGASAQTKSPTLHYKLSFPNPAEHTYQVNLEIKNWNADSLILKMPRWMPGYYQFMEYGNSVFNMKSLGLKNEAPLIQKMDENTWKISRVKKDKIELEYAIKTFRKFVANSYVDSAHAYIVPANSFLYIEDHLNLPVTLTVISKKWNQIATGLGKIKENEFSAPDFDILYDCPLLIGNLTELPFFKINDTNHRFVGYDIGNFDHTLFIDKLKKIVEASIHIIGDIPYKEYSFIAIGPGRGGIEHLNNTTFSFTGNGLNTEEGMNRMLNFLAHEYFHHYNVKRIRPLELGPFDYHNGNRTNLLWVSEGLSVYYEYLIVKRAGLSDLSTLLDHFNKNLNAHENNPGRDFQSLQQASYSTWQDGPFGTQGKEPGKAISYYDKGPLVSMLLDFKIRHKTSNAKSLDDVMRMLYFKYYKSKQRGFTEAEFQEVCEQIAGSSLSDFFEYVYTTKAVDYANYLDYAGLELEKTISLNQTKYRIVKKNDLSVAQKQILNSWIGEE